jgi:hypothetical protein
MRVLVFLATLLLAHSSLSAPLVESPGQVWNVSGRQWSVEDEYQFGDWVEANITEDFFVRYKIPVDCADVPYAVRWIYSRVSHLPAAATTKDGKLIGHWSTHWKDLPTDAEWHKDRRFRAALLHMLAETTTRTLPLDTYPIRIDPESVTAGTVFFVTESHSGIIGRVSLDGSYAHPLQTWEATVPAKIQKMNQKNFLSPRPESTIYSGLVKFRWPVMENGRWQLLPEKQHPFYSKEQYSSLFYEGYADFMDAVGRRIDPTEYDPWEKMLKVLHTTARFVRDRIPIVLEGYKRCRRGGCREGSDLWETYSTPGRDGFIILLMDHLRQLIESNSLDPEAVKQEMETLCFDISRDRSITFYQLYQDYLWLSPHPEDPVEARWGLRQCDMILARVRQGNKSIRFIERTYRKKDPKYADFSTRQQREIIRRLWVDWDRFQCEDTDVWRKEGKP